MDEHFLFGSRPFFISLSSHNFFLLRRREMKEWEREREKNGRRKECFSKSFKGTISEAKDTVKQNFCHLLEKRIPFVQKEKNAHAVKYCMRECIKISGPTYRNPFLVLLVSCLPSSSSYWWLCFKRGREEKKRKKGEKIKKKNQKLVFVPGTSQFLRIEKNDAFCPVFHHHFHIFLPSLSFTSISIISSPLSLFSHPHLFLRKEKRWREGERKMMSKEKMRTWCVIITIFIIKRTFYVILQKRQPWDRGRKNERKRRKNMKKKGRKRGKVTEMME